MLNIIVAGFRQQASFVRRFELCRTHDGYNHPRTARSGIISGKSGLDPESWRKEYFRKSISGSQNCTRILVNHVTRLSSVVIVLCALRQALWSSSFSVSLFQLSPSFFFSHFQVGKWSIP